MDIEKNYERIIIRMNSNAFFDRSNPDQPRVGRRARISVGLTNPLKEELTNCVFGIEAPGFVDSMKRRFR